MQCHPAALTVVRKLHLGTLSEFVVLDQQSSDIFSQSLHRFDSMVDLLYHCSAICTSSFYVDSTCSACIDRVSQNCGTAGRRIVLAGW